MAEWNVAGAVLVLKLNRSGKAAVFPTEQKLNLLSFLPWEFLFTGCVSGVLPRPRQLNVSSDWFAPAVLMRNIVGYLLKEQLNVTNRPLVATEKGNVGGGQQVKLLFSASCNGMVWSKRFQCRDDLALSLLDIYENALGRVACTTLMTGMLMLLWLFEVTI